jgi:hypothetical protein
MEHCVLRLLLALWVATQGGCAFVHVATDERGRIAGVSYLAVLRQYDARYTFDGPLGDHVSVGIGASSEVEQAMALLGAAARLGAKGMLP